MRHPNQTELDAALSTDVYDQPGHLLRRAHQISTAMFHSIMGYEITPIQYSVLRILQDHPNIDQVTLAKLCALDTSTAANLAARLDSRGLLKRMILVGNKRQRLLHLTREGQDLLDSLVPMVHRLRRELLKPLDKDEQETFLSLLRKLVRLNNKKSRAPLDRKLTLLKTK